jgi:uncharacterized protein YndB with AHSA1/START domain
MKSRIQIKYSYPYRIEEVWDAITDKAALSQWLMDTSDFEPVVGTKFQFRSTPTKHWRGFVDCVVTQVDPQRLISYSWCGDDNGSTTTVTWSLKSVGNQTELTLVHSGFEGVGGFVLSRIVLGPGWKKMVRRKIPIVLAFVKANGKNFPAEGKLAGCEHA